MDAQPAFSELSFKGVTKTFGSVSAVQNLSFSVDKPEFVTLLGPSGCGKTTTLRLVAGLETCDSGQIFMRGHRIDDVPAYRRNVSTVFQDYALFPHLNVIENVAFGLRVRHERKDQYLPKVHDILKRLHIGDLAERRPYQLSGGQQQRVALARTLVLNPSVVLFDEPLGALDQALREEMQIELKRTQREVKVTFIYVTHDQHEAFSMSDRIIILSKGRIEQDSSPSDLYDRPSSPFVARFTGLNHFLRARIDSIASKRARTVLHCGGIADAELADNATFSAGDEVLIGVRPEFVSIGRASRGGTSIEMTVDSLSYGGKTWRIFGRVKSGEEFVVETAAEEFPRNTIREGQKVQLSWPSQRTLVFKVE